MFPSLCTSSLFLTCLLSWCALNTHICNECSCMPASVLGVGAAVMGTLCPCPLCVGPLTRPWSRQNYKQMTIGVGFPEWSNIRSSDIALRKRGVFWFQPFALCLNIKSSPPFSVSFIITDSIDFKNLDIIYY